MSRQWSLFIGLALVLPAASQTLTRQSVASILGFENGRSGSFPAGWTGSLNDTIFIDDRTAHSGTYSAIIQRFPDSSGTFSTLTAAMPLDFAGQTIEWRGWIKTEDVVDAVALWMREDGDTPNLAFNTTQGLGVKGTRNWTQYSISLPVVKEAKVLYVGFLLSGAGRAWVDDLELLVDGKPVAQAPNKVLTPLDTDVEFNGGSQVNITALSGTQVKNLATLAKVWGFLKYHHPAVTAGKHHWDYELFRVLPAVLAAAGSEAAATALSVWISNLGPVPPCAPCASLDTDNLRLSPNIDWIDDEALLGSGLRQTLRNVYLNRTPATRQFFVSLVPNVSNPSFDNELPYRALKLPDSGYQLLGLFRFWNMVQYFYPNRDVIADDPANSPNYWDDVLETSIPGIALARDSLQYQQELLKFTAKINDTHANLWSSIAARPPIGTCQLPVDLRFVEGVPLVIRYRSATAGPASLLAPGDIIEQLDGVAVSELLHRWRPYYADSNEAARLRDVGNYMTRGACGAADVVVRRGDRNLNLRSTRVPASTLDPSSTSTHDLPGETFQRLSGDVAYLKLSSVVASNSASYVEAAAGTRGLILDIRNYPSQFVVFTLGSLLISQPTEFAVFTVADVKNPGAFYWGPRVSLTPAQPRYQGKVVILVDEVTQSQAEYTTMAFRTAPGAIVIGSTTAGADGNVSTVPLPGNFSSYISGIGVYYPDRAPTQRIGIIPDIEVKPTIAAIRAGRDELIEEAIRQITQ